VNLSRRLVIFSFFFLLILFLGMIFWPFILNELITPISLVIWLLLRLLVLSIDQKYYWAAIIFVVLFFLYRLLPQGQAADRPEESLEANATIRSISYWRSLFTFTDQAVRDEKNLKRELIRLLLSLYATKQRTAADFGLYEALQRSEIPLPEHIHDFLFWEEPPKTGSPLKKLVQAISNTPQKWIRHWTGQETAEHYRMIAEVLSFMETSLEMKNDDGKYAPNQH
jgi:hypothetical protein